MIYLETAKNTNWLSLEFYVIRNHSILNPFNSYRKEVLLWKFVSLTIKIHSMKNHLFRQQVCDEFRIIW